MVGSNVFKDTHELKEVIDVDNAPSVPRESRKRGTLKVVYHAESLSNTRTNYQRLLAIDESSDDEFERAIKSRSKSGG